MQIYEIEENLQFLFAYFQLHSNNTFEIIDVNTSDEGLYYCNVSNKYGLNRATNKILVYSEPFNLHLQSLKNLLN